MREHFNKLFDFVYKNKLVFFYIIPLVLVPLASEFAVYPFGGNKRVSLGTPTFLFILLVNKRLNPVIVGATTGLSVVLFRTIYQGFFLEDVTLIAAFLDNFTVFFHYFVYGLLFWFFDVHKKLDHPAIVGLYAVVMEVLATYSDLFLQYLTGEKIQVSLENFILIILIAFVRSFLTIGFYVMLKYRDTKRVEQQHKKQNEKLLLLISDLYLESIQVNLISTEAEDLTTQSFLLHRRLKKDGLNEYSEILLHLADKNHEIKHHCQRVHAGLTKLTIPEDIHLEMPLDEILSMIIKSSRNYSLFLNKKIKFTCEVNRENLIINPLIMASLLNNLVDNAVEAIDGNGEILLKSFVDQTSITTTIYDTGSGITAKNKSQIFNAGFTTKFDEHGNFSNGIGLYHVSTLAKRHNGHLKLVEPGTKYKTAFEIKLPLQSVLREDK